MCTRIETIGTHIRPSWWTPTAKIRVDTTKAIAKDQRDKTQVHSDAKTVTIYTDGSGIEGKIGAAAFNSATNESSHQHLGSEMQFNVYAAELTALYLAAKQLWNHSHYWTYCIYTDS